MLLPGMELVDGERGLALCHDAPKVLPVQVKTQEGPDGPSRAVLVACDADVVIVDLAEAPVRAARIEALVFAGDLNGDGRLEAVIRTFATLDQENLSNGPDAPPKVIAWTLDSNW